MICDGAEWAESSLFAAGLVSCAWPPSLQGQRLPRPVLWEPGMPRTRSEYAGTARPGGFGVYGEGSGRERVIYGGELFLRMFSVLLWSSVFCSVGSREGVAP